MKSTKLLMSLILLTNSIIAFALNTNSATVRVVFPFKTANVILHLWNPCCQDIAMSFSGNNEYSSEVSYLADGLLMFNVEYDIPEFKIKSWWIGAGEPKEADHIPYRFDPHGLKYGKIYINNQLLDNSYAINNNGNNGLNISVKVNPNGTIIPYYSNPGEHPKIDERIPVEAAHHYGFFNTSVPSSEDISVAGWVVALSDNNIIDTSKIEVDYVRVFGFYGSDSTLLSNNEYNSYSPTNDGGLYYRYPFFPEGYDQHDAMPGTVSNGILSFYPSDNIRKVWHWWTPRYITSNDFNFDSYKMECRIRITGHAVAQVGIDFRNASEVVHELGVSDWYFENRGEWQTIFFDTRSFKTSLISQNNSERKMDISYSKTEKVIILDYLGMDTGKYYLNFYNLEGKLLSKVSVNLTAINGEIKIPLHTYPDPFLLYNISNGVFSMKGKIQHD